MGSPRQEVLSRSLVRDVAVIGGGPAGLMAARALAASGHDVVVLEEHDAIGVPVHCTGLLGVDAFDELDIPRHTILTMASAARFFGADGSSVFVDGGHVRAAIVDRAEFDRSLAEGSRAAGAELRAGARIQSISVTADRVLVRGDGEAATVDARACIVACGANYRFNRALGLGVPRAFIQSAQIEAALDGPDHVQVFLGRDVAPGGFAWTVPFIRNGQRTSRIGLMCDSRALARFARFAQSIRSRHAVNGGAWQKPRAKILPLAPVSRTYANRVLVVGDAAGLVKPTTGGGIYYSLLSGRLAADVLGSALDEDDLGASRLREYEQRWRARLGHEIRIGLKFRALASRLSDRAIDSLVELARIDGLVPLLKQTADFNWHGTSALALLRHAQFRRILLGAIWG